MKKYLLTTMLCAITCLAQECEDPFALFKQIRSEWDEAKTNSTIYEYVTGDVWEEYFNQLCVTNKTYYQSTGKQIPFVHENPYFLFGYNKKLEEFITDEEKIEFLKELDSKIVDANLFNNRDYLYLIFPKATKAWLDNIIGKSDKRKFTVLTAILSRYPESSFKKLTLAEQINEFVEKLQSGRCNQKNIPNDIKRYASNLTIPVKKYLRKHGKTFVVGEDGKNPVQDIIDEFTAAIQSPKCASVKEFCIKYLDADWVDLYNISDEEFEDLKEKVFYGELPLNNQNAVRLQYYLGLTGYNAFIEEYNNDAASK